MIQEWLMGLLAALSLLVAGGAAPVDTTGCTVRTVPAEKVGAFYLYGPYEVWQETNGIEGLQRGASSCANGASIPADTCFTHTENRQLQRCAVARAESVTPLP